MKDFIVVSYATHRAGLLDEYEQQLKDARIDFHLEPVTLDDGINSVTMRWKLEYMWRMASKFRDYDSIIFTDAWDVLFFGSRETLMHPSWVSYSGERNCWPSLVDAPGHSSWRYVNAGMCAIAMDIAHKWLREMLKRDDIDVMEQQWLNESRSRRCDFFLDHATDMFYTVSADKEDGAIEMQNGKVFNADFGSYPSFFHFSGKCPTEPFRAMLRGETPTLCSFA